MATFPADRAPGRNQSAVIYLDAKLTQKAQLTDSVSGAVLPGALIVVTTDDKWPLFNCAASIVYYRNGQGQVQSLLPNIAGGSAQTVTGAKSTGAAVTSLIAALAALGIPLTDSTT